MHIYIGAVSDRRDEMLDMALALAPPAQTSRKHSLVMNLDDPRADYCDEEIEEAKRRVFPADICVFFPKPLQDHETIQKVAGLDLTLGIVLTRQYWKPLVYILEEKPGWAYTAYAFKHIIRAKTDPQAVQREITIIAKEYPVIPWKQEFEDPIWALAHPWNHPLLKE